MAKFTESGCSKSGQCYSQHHMVWYGMLWYGMVWYGVVWYGMVLWMEGMVLWMEGMVLWMDGMAHYATIYKVYKKNEVVALNINSKKHKHSLLTSYTPFESPTIQLSNND